MSLPSLISVRVLSFPRQNFSHLEGFPMAIDRARQGKSDSPNRTKSDRPTRTEAGCPTNRCWYLYNLLRIFLQVWCFHIFWCSYNIIRCRSSVLLLPMMPMCCLCGMLWHEWKAYPEVKKQNFSSSSSRRSIPRPLGMLFGGLSLAGRWLLNLW